MVVCVRGLGKFFQIKLLVVGEVVSLDVYEPFKWRVSHVFGSLDFFDCGVSICRELYRWFDFLLEDLKLFSDCKVSTLVDGSEVMN